MLPIQRTTHLTVVAWIGLVHEWFYLAGPGVGRGQTVAPREGGGSTRRAVVDLVRAPSGHAM